LTLADEGVTATAMGFGAGADVCAFSVPRDWNWLS
jgi:hypothetical protein